MTSVRCPSITLNIPEPEVFTLHKLIVCCLRKNPEKAIKDIGTTRGVLMFFEGKTHHVKHFREIYDGFPKGWKQWSPHAAQCLEDICSYINRDSYRYAALFAQRVIAAIELTAEFPEYNTPPFFTGYASARTQAALILR